MSRLLLGIDVGTSYVKASVLDSDSGRVIATGSAEHPLAFPHPGYAEQQAEDYWKATKAALGICLRGVDARAIAGVAFAGLGGCFLGIDAAGEPITPSMIWADTRAESLSSEIERLIGRERIQEVTGNRIAPIFIDQKAMWLQRTDPARFARIDKFVTPNGYCVFRLTGERVMNQGDASFFYPYDYRSGCWRRDISDALGIPFEKYPRLVAPWEMAGRISAKAAEETGLPAGIPVAGGGPDISAAALGSGVTQIGRAFYSMGTASNLGVLIPTSQPLEEYRLIKFGHVVPGKMLLDAPMAFTGAVLRWFRGSFAGNENLIAERAGLNAHELIAAQAGQVGPGADGLMFHPYLGTSLAPYWNPSATGVFFGLRASTTRAHMIRALMEGVAFDANTNIAVARAADIPLERLTMNGGPTKSRIWMQIIADVTGLSLEIPEIEDAGPLGCAILAGTCAGVYDDSIEAAARIVRIRDHIDPEAKNHILYAEMFQLWLSIYERLKPQFDEHRALLDRHGLT